MNTLHPKIRIRVSPKPILIPDAVADMVGLVLKNNLDGTAENAKSAAEGAKVTAEMVSRMCSEAAFELGGPSGVQSFRAVIERVNETLIAMDRQLDEPFPAKRHAGLLRANRLLS